MKKYLFYFALSCWIIGILIHVLSIADINVAEKMPLVWLLHVGIFAVWIPVVLDLRNNQEVQVFQQEAKQVKTSSFGLFKIIFEEIPKWITILAVCGFFYAGINFVLFMFSQVGTAVIKDGQYILSSHGKLIKTITEQEYHHFKANELRGFSGHWIAFYGIATAILFKYSGLTKNKLS
jgi:hypothetical protein